MSSFDLDEDDIKYETRATFAVRGIEHRVKYVEDSKGNIFAQIPIKRNKRSKFDDTQPKFEYKPLRSTFHEFDNLHANTAGINIKPISIRYDYVRSIPNREENEKDVLFAWTPDKAVARQYFEGVPNDEAEAIIKEQLARSAARAEDFMAPVRVAARTKKEQELKAITKEA